MGAPRLEPGEIPLQATERSGEYPLRLADRQLAVGAIDMGNPHAVQRVEDVEDCDFELLGPQVESHPDFPERANAGFMQVVNEQHIRLRVYERGVGETLACGTGACAAVVWGILQGWLQDTVTVELPGGKLSIAWAGEWHPVMMTGPTSVVYEGTIRI